MKISLKKMVRRLRSLWRPELHMNVDAWSQVQIRSKLWMASELERHFGTKEDLCIWILGGWYAVSAFLIFSRGRLGVRRICSFDLDPEVNEQARLVNHAWTFEPSLFFAFEQDCEKLNFREGEGFGPAPDLVINTAMEHFSRDWMDRLPKGTAVCLQSTNMAHPEHLFGCQSLEEFRQQLQGRIQIDYSGELTFKYPHLSFSRYMVIGRKVT